MNRTMRRVIALLLMFMILISSNLTGIVFAAPGEDLEGGVDQGGVGASYNPVTGEADIETGTNSGDIKNYVKPSDWELAGENGTLTPTKYQLKVDGNFYDVGMFYDVDWSNAVSEYKNSKEDIEGFVRAVVDSSDGKRDKLTESGIWGKGFEVHIFAMIKARKPNQTTFDLYNIKEDYNLLMYNKISGTGPRTWISKVVERAGNNLGSEGNGWAYYTVPAQNQVNVPQVKVSQVKVVKIFVKVTGVDANGKLIYEEIQQPEIFPAEVDTNGNFSIEPLTLSSQGIGVLNDVITSTKELEPYEAVKWEGTTPVGQGNKIDAVSTDIPRYAFGIITNKEVGVESVQEGIVEVQMAVAKSGSQKDYGKVSIASIAHPVSPATTIGVKGTATIMETVAETFSITSTQVIDSDPLDNVYSIPLSGYIEQTGSEA